MTRAIKIEGITAMDDTSANILRVISLHLGERSEARVPYMLIAKSLNISRATVSSAVKRMIQRGTLRVNDGKLSICNSILLD